MSGALLALWAARGGGGSASPSISSFSGTFAASGSTAKITSATRTYTLGAGNGGGVQFKNVYTNGSGGLEYSINGGGFVGNAIAEGTTIYLANTDTLAIRCSGLVLGQYGLTDIYDVSTSTNIYTSQSLTRTS